MCLWGRGEIADISISVLEDFLKKSYGSTSKNDKQKCGNIHPQLLMRYTFTKVILKFQKRLEAAAPKSPPLFAPEWHRFTTRESFLQKTAEAYRLDPNSAEGYNIIM